MALYVHRITFQVLSSQDPNALQEPEANYVKDPDLSSVVGFPSRYWQLIGDLFSLVSQSSRDAIDAALLVEKLDAIADEIDRAKSYARAFALVMLDEINILRANDGLAARVASQIKTALRIKLDG